uniref:TYR_PHOSPHATASE_2 domain-containing protein n=1 Tax=Steinernema glaseri TaxID=37863 RepID=A0A1I8ABW4_9BILA
MLAKESFILHPDQCIAVHCVAGLGRAPVLVAIALMEAGMSCEEAVHLIRQQRRGALNQKQLDFLAAYKPSGQLRKLRYTMDAKNAKNCSIM